MRIDMVGCEEHAHVKDVIRTVTATLRKYPVIAMPFILAGLCDLGVLSALVFVLRSPLVHRLGPGAGGSGNEVPAMLLLPQLFGYSKAVTGFAVGMVLTGVAVTMIYQVQSNESPSWLGALRKVARKLVPFFFLWLASLVSTLIFLGFLEGVTPLFPARLLPLGLGFAASCAVQMLFVFVMPVLIVENKKLWPAVKRSLLLLRYHFNEAFLFVVLPNILVIPLLYIYINLPALILQFSPGIVLHVLLARIALVTIANFMISSTTTVLFLRHKDGEKDAAAAYA